ncbi:DNA-binding transcriptional regulator, AcrR family [Leifsonia sp. 98AMF]|uniref:TetR/AcrR family transcriptional regulator n=1 Tax=unclassified Leifsonia TaxID=2663824 RepID=UPI00087C280B|nr:MULTISPECIES: TetR/AcrR family transcriptional regulator [unclassified Leifsonia]SDH59849.1 DNA-binding transcriptional regulator, AcrR family [Leifsonia sp. 197AMF]SDI79255.1 DNA-binding transcriptional regulator, AcrR family [Leifsonia sp. 466MF]SDK06437.1 DNA-binding transcriptional regulator, AcrR family [Leifsonia sp. 157MF]SDN82789.1 DNA-binding transcriptional regulator, AcrR family [Leifsonia sp. 509MF]SEN24459.1 DNA-binding transcriptional regulator, AcrR family [Leifsonia sp. 467M
MTATPAAPGRRERNKQEKLDRIIAAAGALFAERGVDEVTTQEVAAAADIGAGTLFFYARTKGELLLMVQNALYADALDEGREAAQALDDPVDAVLAIADPIIHCNRAQVDNGRTYLREMVFGDPTEPHHAKALEIVAQTEQAMAETIARTGGGVGDPAALAHIVSAILFIAMSASPAGTNVEAIRDDVRRQLGALLG